MPELPDVEVFRRYLGSTAMRKRIGGVEVRARRLLKGVSPSRLERETSGARLERSERHGKYMIVSLDNGKALALHFGMTGELAYFKGSGEEPEYAQVLFSLKNGYRLACISKRKLGRVSLTGSREEFVEKEGLGPDALDIGLERFREICGGRGMIKPLLMNQSRIAGIGNIYSDEILFQAKTAPRAEASELDGKEVGELYRSMRSVLETAIERGADPENLPRTWLLGHRERGGKCPRCGGEVERVEISGRNGYWCPSCQK